MGRCAHLHFGKANCDTRAKIKIILDPPSEGTISPLVAAVIQYTLRFLRELAVIYRSVHRGHRHSSGSSEVSIWLSVDERSSHANYYMPCQSLANSSQASVIVASSLPARALLDEDSSLALVCLPLVLKRARNSARSLLTFPPLCSLHWLMSMAASKPCRVRCAAWCSKCSATSRRNKFLEPS